MPADHALSPISAPQPTERRHGSASSNLSGQTLLGVWGVSVAGHILLFFGMLVAVFPYSTPDRPTEPAPAHVEIVGSLDSAGFTAAVAPDLNRSQPIQNVPIVPTPAKQFSDLSELTHPKPTDLPIIGIGAGGGDLAEFGLTVGDGAGPEFFGLKGDPREARRIVYVVDMSGSMIDTFQFVRDEMKRSVARLRRIQKFHVILFNSGEPLENPPKRLVSAIAAHKEQLFEFLDRIVPRGDTKPERALQRALELEPDMIYLLSDGVDFDPNLVHKLAEWDPNGRVKIFTIAYLDRNGRQVLERIAHEFGGRFRFVSENDLP